MKQSQARWGRRQGCFLRGGLGRGTEAVVHIKTLSAQNFRCFKDLQISFQPGFNLLIGNNMSGKTAVLDALRICLSKFVRAFTEDELTIEKDQVRLTSVEVGDSIDMVRQYPSSVDICVEYGEKLKSELSPIVPSINTDSKMQESGHTISLTEEGISSSQRTGLSSVGLIMASSYSKREMLLPVLCFLGTNRNMHVVEPLEHSVVEKFSDIRRADGYSQTFLYSSSYSVISSWIFYRTMSEIQRKQRGLPIIKDSPLLGIERAVQLCVPQIKQFYFDFEFNQLAVVLSDGRRLPGSMLSDGMHCLLSLAMDIAWRAVVLNPQLGAKAPEQATGIVLIDELDLALHPVWQRRIVGDLSRAFPSIQFIATTHSPQIIGSAKNALVQQIDGDQVSAVNRPFGLDSNTVLTEIMGGEERDRAIVALFAEVNQLMNDKKWDEARQKLTAIGEQIDRQDTELVRLRARIDFLSRAASRN